MKNLLIPLYIYFLTLWPAVSNAETDSIGVYENHRLVAMYMNLDTRLKYAESAIDERSDKFELLTLQIDRRLERIEDKFDRYFLWGYGTLMSIFMVSLAWFMNKFKAETTRNTEPPPPGLKITKSRFLSSS